MTPMPTDRKKQISDWLQCLIQVPFVLLISERNGTAQLEIDGSAAQGVSVGDCAFVGIALRGIAEDCSDDWLIRAAAVVAAREGSLDDALQLDRGHWLLTRRYGTCDLQGSPVALEERLAAHLELAGELTRIAQCRGSRLNTHVGKLV